MGTQNISSLKLSAKAQKAAEELLEQFPDTVFTSGRRDLAGQARAMAGNVVKKRDYIEKTYAASDASRACQKWVDDHPEAKTREAIAAGLLETLKGLGNKAGRSPSTSPATPSTCSRWRRTPPPARRRCASCPASASSSRRRPGW
jgi:hypothetical protein